MQHRGWILCSGFLWLIGGIFLLNKGVSYIGNSWLLFAGVLLGFVKGRFVFAKTVQRIVKRIQDLPLPIRISQVYPPIYLALIGVMVLLGAALRFAPEQVRGVIDVAVGSALVQGAMLYFRASRKIVTAS
jgi:hypothetical protein